MIIWDEAGGFGCVAQHDHAQLSGWLAENWGSRVVPPLVNKRTSLVLAAKMHDYGWVAIDADPAWNAAVQKPYTFQDEAVLRKLPHYRSGIERAEEIDSYAGLLCSLHYTSFFTGNEEIDAGDEIREFLRQEQARQAIAMQHLTELQNNQVQMDLGLLKLWDHLSLFVGLNPPGTETPDLHPWYRVGFPPTVLQVEHPPVSFSAHWRAGNHLVITPYPLRGEGVYILPYRFVSHQEIHRVGYNRAYQQAPVKGKVIRFVQPETS